MLQNEPHHLLFLRLLSLLFIFYKLRDFAEHIQSEARQKDYTKCKSWYPQEIQIDFKKHNKPKKGEQYR